MAVKIPANVEAALGLGYVCVGWSRVEENVVKPLRILYQEGVNAILMKTQKTAGLGSLRNKTVLTRLLTKWERPF